MKLRIACPHAHWEDLLYQIAATEDKPSLTEMKQKEERELNSIEEEQAHRTQITLFFKMQLQVMDRVEALEQQHNWCRSLLEQMQREMHDPPGNTNVDGTSERELPSLLAVMHQTSPLPQSPEPQIQEGVLDILSSTNNVSTEIASNV